MARTHRFLGAILVLLLILLGTNGGEARADLIVSFNPSNTYSGTAPAGSLTLDFSNVGTNEVQLVIGFPASTGSALGSGENLDPGKAIYLNFDKPNIVSDLKFTLQSNSGFGQASSVQFGSFEPGSYNANYPILMTYSPGTKAFTTGESQTYLITLTGPGSFSASDFDVGAGPGGYLGFVHVQNTPDGGPGSAWVGGSDPAPEPSTLAIAGLGAIGFVTYGLRKRMQKPK